VDIPLGVLVVLTGVAGSGKSSLVTGSVSRREGVVTVDQGAIKGSRRSNPATYTGCSSRSARHSPRPTG
jgi:excinuclease UvrABC ATPase subunit